MLAEASTRATALLERQFSGIYGILHALAIILPLKSWRRSSLPTRICWLFDLIDHYVKVYPDAGVTFQNDHHRKGLWSVPYLVKGHLSVIGEYVATFQPAMRADASGRSLTAISNVVRWLAWQTADNTDKTTD